MAQTAKSVNIHNKRVSAMQSEDNDSILARIADGENGSFELLIEKYGNLVWSIGKKFSKTIINPIAESTAVRRPLQPMDLLA